ncbi:MAG: hypothetical protein GY749_15140 [Desulfobacteraceae bacterium]|nr:hypothetical protein [Desulfobacteraceae bacterium]
MTLWEGVFDGMHKIWLRWVDHEGNLLLNGDEQRHRKEKERHRADMAEQKAEEERHRAVLAEQKAEKEQRRKEKEQRRADMAEQKAEILAAKLRAMGIDPEG